jgi:transcriptional regulator with XRE-family HTH domain
MLSRIAELVGKKHGAKKSLAAHLRISPAVVTDWFSGRNKSYPKYASQIAEYFGVSLDYLSGVTDRRERITGNDKPATISDDGLSEIISIFSRLNSDNRSKLLELSHLYLTSQSSNSETR